MNKLKLFKIIGGTLMVISVLSVGCAIYAVYLLTGIETFYRIMGSILLILFLITLIYSIIDSIKFYRKKKFIISSILTTLMIILGLAISIVIYTVYLKLNNMTNTPSTDMHKTALVAFKDLGKINKLKDIKIGIVDNKDDIDAYILPQDVINKYELDKNNEIVSFEDKTILMTALMNEEVDAIFINSNYEGMFRQMDNFDKKQEIYLINSYEKEYKKKDNDTVSKPQAKVTEPFTILLLGVDSEEDGLNAGDSFNGDTIMLVSVDPETLHATMFSVPRDTYTPICSAYSKSCGSPQKITHAAWGGTQAVINTVENLTGLTIDYYAKINFKGVVDLVNILGGITVDVPMEFCESNSHRWQDDWEICLKPGVQTLYGEEALALARHRKTLALGDFQRGQNQQLVVEGMINKLKTLRSVNDFLKVLDTISNNIETNMSTDQMLSFYNVGKAILTKEKDVQINITKTFLTGYDLYVWEGYMSLYTFQYYRQSLESIVNAMKVNLRQIPATEIKTFNFSINNPYEKSIVGYEYYAEARKQLVPNFAYYTVDEAKSWGNSHGINIVVNEVESTLPNQYTGQILTQDVHEGVILDKCPRTITITVAKKVNAPVDPTEPTNPTDPENPVDPEKPDENEGGEGGEEGDTPEPTTPDIPEDNN